MNVSLFAFCNYGFKFFNIDFFSVQFFVYEFLRQVAMGIDWSFSTFTLFQVLENAFLLFLLWSNKYVFTLSKTTEIIWLSVLSSLIKNKYFVKYDGSFDLRLSYNEIRNN